MGFKEQHNNVYCIDSMMFGFKNYQSCYIVAGKEVVLIDSGISPQIEAFKKGMKKHGFSIQDVTKIFLTHCEHPDHAGNAGIFVKENPKIKVYINPAGLEYMTNPSIEADHRKKVMLPQMAARFGEQLPLDRSSIVFLKDGDEFDIGNGEKLKIMFTPAHQPSGLVIFEEKNKGLFINDIVGNYFTDVDFNLILTPHRSDVFRAKSDLQTFQMMDIKVLYLGHYGIIDEPQTVYTRALAGIQRILDIADQCVKAGKPGEMESKVLASRVLDIENLKKRSQELYDYTRQELITHHSTYFAQFYLEHNKNI